MDQILSDNNLILILLLAYNKLLRE